MQTQVILLPVIKKCCKCRKELALAEFPLSKIYKSGISNECRTCYNTRKKENARSVKTRRKQREWRLSNIEKERIAAQKRRKKNVLGARLKDREYYAKNKDKMAIRSAKRCKEAYYDPRIDVLLRLKNLRSKAKRCEMEFNLEPCDIIIPEYCPALGIKLEKGNSKNAPSVDRINNNKGYIKGNVIVVSKLANVIKNCATADQILSVGNFYKRLEIK